MHNGFLALSAAIMFAVAGAACDNTARGVKQDAAEAKSDAEAASAEAKAEAREESADAKRAAGEMGADAKSTADEVGAEAKRTAGNAGTAVAGATETVDVKMALMADASVDASDINVDTLNETKTVVLKGSVPTAAQKAEAGKIAAREAEGYKVNNQLTVKPRS